MLCSIRSELKDNIIIIFISDREDDSEEINTKQEIMHILNASDEAHNVIIDFEYTDYIDSLFLGALIIAQKSIEGKNKKMALTNLSTEIKIILEISKLISKFSVYDSIEEAMQALKEE